MIMFLLHNVKIEATYMYSYINYCNNKSFKVTNCWYKHFCLRRYFLRQIKIGNILAISYKSSDL